MQHVVKKTYDPQLDQLIERLMDPWDAGPSGGYEFVVDAQVAAKAAEKLLELHDALENCRTQNLFR
jgi:hypothetical protein